MQLVRYAVIFICAILSAGRLAAQSADCLHRTVTVNILDSKSQVVDDLRPEDLSGSFRHKRVKISSVTPNSFLPRIFIVFDASASMTDIRSTWKYSIEAANRLVDSMPAGATAGLIIFAKNIEKELPLGTSKAEIKEEIEKLRVGNGTSVTIRGATALWDALNEAISEMQPAREGDAIYAITDGIDNSSKINTKRVKEAFLATGIRFFSFSLDNPEMHPIPDSVTRFRDFRYLAWDSGGFAIMVPLIALATPDFLDNISGRHTEQSALLLAQLHQLFLYQRVGIVLPEPPEKAAEWSLNFKRQDVHDPAVVYPHILSACAEPKTAARAAH